MQFVHVPSVSVMDLSPPSMEQHAPSNKDAPSTPTQKMAGLVSEITPRKMYVILFYGLRRQVSQHFMACLNWLLLPVGPKRVAGASAKEPDSGEQPSTTQAPGAEQVKHTSS